MEYPCGKFSNCSFVRFGSVAFSRDVRDGFFKFGSVSFRFSEKPWVRFGFGFTSVLKRTVGSFVDQ